MTSSPRIFYEDILKGKSEIGKKKSKKTFASQSSHGLKYHAMTDPNKAASNNISHDGGLDVAPNENVTYDTDTNATVSFLLGKSKASKDIKQTVTQLRGSERTTPSSTKEFQNGEITYENYNDIGLSLEFLNETVDCIHLYNETNNTDFTPFPRGQRIVPPFDIDFAKDAAKDVVSKLGEPTSKGGTGVQIFIVYEMLGIKISFNANDWEQAGASIHSMAVWKASEGE